MVVGQLGIGDRVRVVRGRAEEHQGFYDVVTCRAVARLDKLLGWTVQLFSPGGRLLALKGESASKDLDAAASNLRRRKLSGRVETVHVTPDAEPTRVIVVG
jgi:16S rRNA (guanine527-N7)-methyltransferase